MSRIVVGLDIGTTKICAAVGEVREDGIDLIGFGTYPSEGLRKGVVINIEKTVNSIKAAVEEAETMAGCQISSVYAGIAGAHIQSFNTPGVIALKEKEVTRKDIERVIEAASAVAIPMDREVIHTLVQEFIVDDQDGILDPLGMVGVRLEAKVHLVTGALTSAQNIIKCANRAGLDVQDLVLECLASSEAVLTPEEKKLGTAVIEFGGGTTDTAVFSRGSVKHTSVLPLGGDNLTHDIAVGLRTPTLEAEKIKIKYGCALSTMIHKDDTLEVPGVGGRRPRTLSREILGKILEPRVEEIFTLIYSDLVKAGCEDMLTSGLVITGGSSELPGVTELAEQVFNAPARVGYPQGVGGLLEIVQKPMYATAVGLVIYGSRMFRSRKRFGKEGLLRRFLGRIKRWFLDVV